MIFELGIEKNIKINKHQDVIRKVVESCFLFCQIIFVPFNNLLRSKTLNGKNTVSMITK